MTSEEELQDRRQVVRLKKHYREYLNERLIMNNYNFVKNSSYKHNRRVT